MPKPKRLNPHNEETEETNTRNNKSSVPTKKKPKKSKTPAPSPIPVTILSGFLGGGKTTLLQHILTSKDHKLKIAVIVNDMAELNVDGHVINRTLSTSQRNKNNIINDAGDSKQQGRESASQQKTVVSTLENGCICCTLRGDLIRELYNIQQNQPDIDYVIIESTGIAEPQQVAESFCVDPETQALALEKHQRLDQAVARLDTCVTVVDALHFPEYLRSLQRFQDVFQDGLDDAQEGEGEKSIAELMVEQVEFANVIVLNKVDLVDDPRQIETAKALIRRLNPKARVLMASYGKIDLSQILNTRLFSMEEASESPGWLLSLKEGVNASSGEADEYGVTSIVYRARRPFHPLRLRNMIKKEMQLWFVQEWNAKQKHGKEDTLKDKNFLSITSKGTTSTGTILRSKGSCWIAGRDHDEISWTHVGRIIQLSPTAPWHCVTSEEEWDEDDKDEILAKMCPSSKDEREVVGSDPPSEPYKYGDRRQEIVLIGIHLDPLVLTNKLNECLLTEEEMSYHSVDLPIGAYADPLPPALVSCDTAKSLFMIVRHGQNQHIRIHETFVCTIHSIALKYQEHDEFKIRAVRVWLDKSDDLPVSNQQHQHHGILIGTLRPFSCEQLSVSIPILSCNIDGGETTTNRRLRLEVIREKTQQQGAPVTSSNDDLMMACCEVHVLAKSEPVPYSVASDSDDHSDDSETDNDENDDEIDGKVSMHDLTDCGDCPR
ncbi:cobalamin vitamin b12 biosynthesis cobw-like protein [Nitzschia inconspicua]|uniref:Cobalamin vitamin b12 biosynthesis cobw-like protein n=1 Tax=Nitzschia inconspicua TaxID=303405 RepID=A0A9K3KTM8_9STRA|nr:cobalamin vitamin b12 biosynthesis cobw-like protein [Nitzschia inconspicua]